MFSHEQEGGLAMAVPESTLWDRDPHTEAKHRVLAGYFDAWYPIMLNHWPRLTVFEGYAGPGEHTKGEEGSPIIALRRLLDRPELTGLGKPVRFVFVEEREDRIDHLRRLVAAKFPDRPRHIQVDCVHGSCEQSWQAALTGAHAWGQPIFANLDPFGAGVPAELVVALGKNKGSEVMVTFMSDWLRRFAKLEHLDDGDRQFGTRRWRQVSTLESPEEKELFLVNEYRETLARAGLGLSARFRLSDEGGRSFFLTYGTSHPKGLEKMKDSMWKTDPVRGIQFRDPRDPEQGVLELGTPNPDLTPLVRHLRRRIEAANHAPVTLEELQKFTLLETAFRPPHATQVVRQMLAAGQLDRRPQSGQLSKPVKLLLAS